MILDPFAMPTIDLDSHYRHLTTVAQSVLDEALSDPQVKLDMGKSLALLSDLHSMIDCLSGRPETEMLSAAALEYQYGLYAISTGAYRHAFLSLRLTLEMTLNAFLFSAYEIHMQQWRRGSRDTSWKAIVDEDEGLFSKQYYAAFCPTLIGLVGQYRGIAVATYRECSQYVHGNPHTHALIGNTVKFQKPIIENWHSLAQSAHLLLLFCFCGRFGESRDNKIRSTMKPIISETFSHTEELKELFNYE